MSKPRLQDWRQRGLAWHGFCFLIGYVLSELVALYALLGHVVVVYETARLCLTVLILSLQVLYG